MEVVWISNERWMRNIWFLKDAEKEFIIHLALALTPMIFAPSELAPLGYLFIVHKGLALYGPKLLCRSK